MYLRPATLRQACEALASGPHAVLAGGTDHYAGPARRDVPLLDLTAIAELRGIRADARCWRLGATTTWTEVIEAPLPPLFRALKLAAREVGGVQIQNAGTVAGNLCNASPAADGVPALLALDASVELADASSVRVLKVEDFVLGPRRTALRPGELVTAVLVPKPAHAARSHFAKLGARRYLVISIAMVAIVLETERGVIRAARVAVGACSPVARRLAALESALVGETLADDLGTIVRAEHLSGLQPIEDVRASAEYRLDAAQTLVRRALDELGAGA